MKKATLAITAGVLILLGLVLYFLMLPNQKPKTGNDSEGRSYSIGVLVDVDAKMPIVEGTKEQLAEWGYVEGKNVTYTVQNSKGDRKKLKGMAASLVEGKHDVILTTSTSATMPFLELIKGTNQKVVFLNAGDPLRLVTSFIKPGGNITGVCSGEAQAIEKRIYFIKKMIPSAGRAAVILNPDAVNYKRDKEEYQEVLPKLGIEIEIFEAATLDEVTRLLKKIRRERFDMLFHGTDLFLQQDVTRLIIPHTISERIAAVSTDAEPVRAGMLLSYDSPVEYRGRQAARIVRKVLEGGDPAVIPVEMPDKYYLYINMKTARAIGLKVPPEILRQADKVFE